MLSFSGTTSYPEQDGVEGTGCAACGLLTVHQFEKVHKSEMRTMQVEEKQKESVFFFFFVALLEGQTLHNLIFGCFRYLLCFFSHLASNINSVQMPWAKRK